MRLCPSLISRIRDVQIVNRSEAQRENDTGLNKDVVDNTEVSRTFLLTDEKSTY